MKPQVSQHFGEFCQVTESGVTEPGLQAEALSAPHSHPKTLRSRPLAQVTGMMTKTSGAVSVPEPVQQALRQGFVKGLTPCSHALRISPGYSVLPL